ncbi:MAG: hypothetical protein K6G75_12020 [Lachnospiraceae bacterium]|nr:hypothetical protein [Lachnospiraceae bacterium]
MKRKILCMLLSVMTISFAVGCTAGDITGKEGGSGYAVLNTESGTTGGTENPDNPDVTADPGDNGITENVEVKDSISNNGGNFIGIDGKVYFRQLGEYVLYEPSSLRHAFDSGTGGYGSSICCFDPENPEKITTVSEGDNGQGELYYYDGYIYSTRYDWNNGIPYPLLYRTNISTGEIEDIEYGRINITSEDTRFIVLSTYDQESGTTISIYDAGKECGSYFSPLSDGYICPIAVDSDNLFLLAANSDTCDAVIYQYDYKKDKRYILGNVFSAKGISEYITFPVIKNSSLKDDTLSFTLCYCEGIDDYVTASSEVSVSVNHDESDFDGAIFTPSVNNDNAYADKLAEELIIPADLKALEVTNEGENGFARAIQVIEQVYDKDYVIVANCFIAPMWHQAQNVSYETMSLDYYYLDDEHPIPQLFNEENPTNIDLMVKAWFVGERGSAPEKLLFQFADIQGPEGPFDFDSKFYTAEFSDDFVFMHMPEDGDFYDTFVPYDMDYLVEYLDSNDYFNPYLSELPAKDEENNYVAPKESFNQGDTIYAYLHIRLDREGKIDCLRYVYFE